MLNPMKKVFTGENINKECSIISLGVENNIKEWQLNIYNEIDSWVNS